MYWTISKFKVKLGAWEMLRQPAERAPQVAGEGAMMVFQMDADRSEVYLVAVAEDEKAYRATSENPEMHEAYLERLQWLESEPEWNDGKVVLFKHNAVPDGAQLYGSIAEMQVKQGALEALLTREDVDSQPEGAVALCVFQMDSDPNQVFLAAISESEAAYRAYSESEASHEQYVEMIKWLECEPAGHDGHVFEYRVFAS